MGSRRFLIEFKDRELFKSLEESRGSLVALGENANQFIDCEKVTLLVSTNQIWSIDEVVDIEVGKVFHRVRIVELGPNAQDSSKQVVENMENLSRKLDSEIRDFSSESSSESVRSKTLVNMERSKRLDEDEAVIAICMGNLPYDGVVMNEYEETRHVGEADLTGCKLNDDLVGLDYCQKIFHEDVSYGVVQKNDKGGQHVNSRPS
ncbi:hypothetical protein V6N13_039380 [Hibiscus sabdariffa]